MDRFCHLGTALELEVGTVRSRMRLNALQLRPPYRLMSAELKDVSGLWLEGSSPTRPAQGVFSFWKSLYARGRNCCSSDEGRSSNETINGDHSSLIDTRASRIWNAGSARLGPKRDQL